MYPHANNLHCEPFPWLFSPGTWSRGHQEYRNFLLLLFSPFSSFGAVPKEEKGKPKESFRSFGPKAHKARPLACLHLLWAYQT